MATPRFGFAGTPDFAADVLAGLLQHGLRPCLALTGPDRPRGRGRRAMSSAVKRLALAQGIPVQTPSAAQAAAPLAGEPLDTVVVAAYGLLLPKAFLDTPRYGCVNLHASLLPRWRGAAPIERALMAGDRETGVSIMQMDEGLDTGPIIAQARLPIGERSTGAELSAAVVGLGVRLLCDILPNLAEVRAVPQRGQATYARKLSRCDALADWRRPAEQIDRAVRALAYRLPVYSLLGDVRVQVLMAEAVPVGVAKPPGLILAADAKEIVVACGAGALRLKAIRLNCGKGSVLGPAEAINGYGDLFQPGARFHGP